MNQTPNVEESYITLVEFLMSAKQRVFELGTEYGLSGMQVITLLLLKQPSQMSKFKRIFNCDPSNVTGIIDGLESKRLVHRYENAIDRRTKMVKLLPRGKQLRTELLAKLAYAENHLLANLNQTEVTTLLALIDKMTV